MTEALKKRRRTFDDCPDRYYLLTIDVAGGRGTLSAVNGMPFSPAIPEHVCLSDGLRRVVFPRASSTARLVVPLDLRPAREHRP